jgi:hypothetical protein
MADKDVKNPDQSDTTDASSTAKRAEDPTGAGQEAARGLPEEHQREHQSNYGGGGPNGGAQKA